MADKIKVNQSVRLLKGALKHEFTPPQILMTMTGSLVYDVTLSVGTAEETAGPTFGDIGTEGLCVVYNLDSTNYVQIGFATTVYGIRLYGGGAPAIMTLEPNATLYLKANTAACNVRIIVYEK